MSPALRLFLRELLAELRHFGAPLAKAAASPQALQQLLTSLGWSFEGLLHAELDPALQIVRVTLDDLVMLAEGLVPALPEEALPDLPELSPSPELLAGEAAAAARAATAGAAASAKDALQRAARGLAAAAQQLREAAVKIVTAAIPTTADAAGQQAAEAAQAAAALAADLLDLLVRDWLRRRWPVGLAICQVTGLVSEEEQAAITVQIGERRAVVRSALKRPCTKILQLPQLAGSLLGQALARAGALRGEPQQAAGQAATDAAGAALAGAQGLLASLPPDPLATLRHDLERLELALRAMGAEEPQLTVSAQGLSLVGVLPGPPGEPLSLPLTLGGITLTLAGSSSGSTGTWSLSWAVPALAPGALGLQLPAPFGLELAMTGAGPGAAAPSGPAVTLQRSGGVLGCTLAGGLAVKLPADLITAAGTDAQISGSASATLVLALGAQPRLTIEQVSFDARDLRLGGKSGLLVSGAIKLEHLCLPWSDAELPELTVEGSCQLAGGSGSASVAFTATLGKDGFALESTGALELAGLRLRPLPLPAPPGSPPPTPPASKPGADAAAQQPVLQLKLGRGLGASAKLDVEVHGAANLPVDAGLSADPAHAVAVGLDGSASAQLSAEGGAALLSVTASGGLLAGSVVKLPGGLLLEALAATLSWSSQTSGAAAAGLAVGLAGQVRAGANAAGGVRGTAAFSGTVRWDSGSGQPSLSGNVTLDGVSFTKDLLIVEAALGLDVTPARCRLTLAKGKLGLLAKQPAPRLEADFHLFAKDVGGACDVGADGHYHLGLTGTAVLPAELGGGTAPTAVLDAAVTGTVSPFTLALAADSPDLRPGARAGARLTVDALSLGGARVKPATLTVEGVALPLLPASKVTLSLDGTLVFPGAGSVAVEGELAVTGSPPSLQAHLACKAALQLPGGLTLLPLTRPGGVQPPTLDARIALGAAAASASFKLNTRLLLPQDGVEKEVELLDGDLELSLENGAPALKLLWAKTVDAPDSTWILPGGLQLWGFGAELKLEAVASGPSGFLSLWGTVRDPRLTGGKASFAGSARGSGKGFAATGRLVLDDVAFAELCIAHAALDLAVTTAPSCTLKLTDGLVGFQPRPNPASPKTAADFELAFDQLAAELDVTGTQASADLSGTLLLPDAFSSADGRGHVDLGGPAAPPAGPPPSDSAPAAAGKAPPPPGASLVLKRRTGSTPASLELRSLALGLGGLRLGGKDGLLLKSGHLSLRNFALPPEAASGPWAVAVDGAIDFPGGGEITLAGSFDAGGFKLASTLDLELGDGFVIHKPRGGGPTLELDVLKQGTGDGAAKIHFLLAGGIEFPGGPLAPEGGDAGRASGVIPPTQRIDASGFVDLTVKPGSVELDAFEAKGSSPSIWRLPCGLQLSALAAEVSHSPQETVISGRGRLELGSFVTATSAQEPDGATLELFLKRTDDNLHLHGGISDVHLDVAGHLRVFGGTFTADFDTNPVGAVLTVEGASAGLLLKEGCSGATVEDYHFAVEGLSGSLEVSRGFRLKLTQGSLHLPAAYLPSEGAGVTLPKVAIGDVPLTLDFDQGKGELSLGGSLVLTDGAIAAGAGNAPRATLDHARLVFEVKDVPLSPRAGIGADRLSAYAHLDGVSGTVHLPLPDGKGVDLEFKDGTWDAGGFPLGTVGVKNDIELAFGGGGDEADAFVLVFPGQKPGATDFVNSVIIAPRPGEGGHHDFTINGAVGLRVPLKLLSNSDPAQSGENLYAEAEGSIEFSDAPGSEVTLDVKHLEFGGSFRLGSDAGLVVEDAKLVVDNLDKLLRRTVDAADPFTLTLTGKIGVNFSGKQGPSLGVKDARFSFDTLDLSSLQALPKFTIKEFEFDQGEALSELPIAIRHATFGFHEEDRPLYSTSKPRLLDPDNIQIGCSLEAKLPFGDDGAAMARADDLQASIDGGKLHLSVGGIGFGIDGLEIGPVGMSGALYIGGLDSDPFKPFFAGKVGGEFDGTGLTVLLACEVDKPLGASLEVEGGTVGIPLGPTGFLITGAAGGISFLNTPIDPSDLSKYITINQPVDSKTPPAAPTRTDQKFPEEPPPPDPAKQQGPAASGAAQSGNQAGNGPQSGNGAQSPANQQSGGKKSLPTVRPDALASDGCPGDCPPPSMNILCQPHPDQAMYPGRAIFKFSAIDESFLLRIVPAEKVQQLKQLKAPGASTVDEIVSYLDHGLRQVSGFDRLPLQPEQLRKAANDGLLLARTAFADALKKAFLAYPAQDAWEVLRATAWAGVPCQDRTLQVTGQLSYAGVSAVLTIEGGVSISTTGNAGVIGYLNFLGMKVGKLRGFVTVTDDQGRPDPSLCADLEVVIGPLELGHVKLGYRYGINVGELADALAGVLVPYADRLLRPLLVEVVAPALRGELQMPADGQGDFDAAQALRLLAARAADAARSKDGGLQQLLALVERIFSGAFIQMRQNASPQELAKLVYRLVDVVWQAYDPEIKFCAVGEVKIFGFSLGKLVEIQGNAGKDHFFARLTCSNGVTTTRISAYFFFPNFYSLMLEGIGQLLEVDDVQKLPDKLKEIATTLAMRTLAQMSHDAVIVGSLALAPLGFTLGQVVVRVLLPNLTDYPAEGWTPPASPLPSRVEVLAAAVRDGVLADDHWRGMPEEMAKLKLPAGKSAAGTHLIDTFFPHGGLIGAGFLHLPSFFTEAPPVDDFLTVIDGHQDLKVRGPAALKLVGKLLDGGSTDLGALALYLPPPALPTGVLEQVKDHPEQFLEALRGLQFPSGPEPLVQLFNQGAKEGLSTAKLCFFRGNLKGRLFGVDFLDAVAEFVPAGSPDQAAPKVDPRAKAPPAGPPPESILKISVDATTGTGVIGQLIPAQAALEIVVRGKQPQPLEKTFEPLRQQLRQATAAGHSASAVMARALGELKTALERDLPKASLRTKVDVALRLPPALQPYLTLEEHVALYAYTPGFAVAEDGTIEGRAKVRGGVGFHGKLRLGYCGLTFEEKLELAVEVDQHQQARVRGQLRVAIAAGGCRELAASFDSSPGPGEEWVKVSGSVDLGSFDIGPWKADVLGVQREIFPKRTIGGGAHCSFVLRAGPSGLGGSFTAQVQLDPQRNLTLADLAVDLGPSAQAKSTAKLLESMTAALSQRLVAEVQKEVDAEVQRLIGVATKLAAEVQKALGDAKQAADKLKQDLDGLTQLSGQAVGELKKAKEAAEKAFDEATKHIPGYKK